MQQSIIVLITNATQVNFPSRSMRTEYPVTEGIQCRAGPLSVHFGSVILTRTHFSLKSFELSHLNTVI